MSIVSFAVNCNSPMYKRMDALYNRIADIADVKSYRHPRVWLYRSFDIRRIIFDEFTTVQLVAAELVYVDPDRLRELEETLKLLWSPYHKCYVPYWQLWLSGTVFAGILALALHAISSLLGSLSVYL